MKRSFAGTSRRADPPACRRRRLRGQRPHKARDLYASAACRAVAVTNRLRSADHPQASRHRAVRAFCYRARMPRTRGRRSKRSSPRADVPAWRATPPRGIARRSSVRRRMLPSIIQQCATAKAAYKYRVRDAAEDLQVLNALAGLTSRRKRGSRWRICGRSSADSGARGQRRRRARCDHLAVATNATFPPCAPHLHRRRTGVVPPVAVNRALPPVPGR